MELLTPKRGAKLELTAAWVSPPSMSSRSGRRPKSSSASLSRVTTKEERTAKILTLLAEKLELAAPPKRIEAYDISNTGASDIVSWMPISRPWGVTRARVR